MKVINNRADLRTTSNIWIFSLSALVLLDLLLRYLIASIISSRLLLTGFGLVTTTSSLITSGSSLPNSMFKAFLIRFSSLTKNHKKICTISLSIPQRYGIILYPPQLIILYIITHNHIKDII